MNNMETFWSTSHAAGAQSSYLESLYESYLENPSSVPDDWKIYFESLPSINGCLLYTSPSPRDKRQSRMPSSA